MVWYMIWYAFYHRQMLVLAHAVHLIYRVSEQNGPIFIMFIIFTITQVSLDSLCWLSIHRGQLVLQLVLAETTMYCVSQKKRNSLRIVFYTKCCVFMTHTIVTLDK